jgi:hypothetical protein
MNPSHELVRADSNRPFGSLALPDIAQRAGIAAVFAAEEFFFGHIRNEHTRAAYLRSVRQFLSWCDARGLELVRITPKDVGQYLDTLRKCKLSIATRKQQLDPLRSSTAWLTVITTSWAYLAAFRSACVHCVFRHRSRTLWLGHQNGNDTDHDRQE